MNPEAFERFSIAYRAGLLAAVIAAKGGTEDGSYAYSPDAVPEVAERMLAAMRKNPRMVNYVGGGFRRACKTLGIKCTRKAIFEYLGVTP